MNNCENCIEGRPRIGRLAGETRTIRLAIFEGEGVPTGTPQDLTAQTVVVRVLLDGTNDIYVPDFVVEGTGNNVVKFVWPANRQAVGNYTLDVTMTDGSNNVNRVNWHGKDGIRLVQYSNQVYGEDATGQESSEAVGLVGYFTTNGVGMSAFDEWRGSEYSEGYPQTVAGFMAYLKQPATDAANAARQQMQQIQSRADEDHTRAGNDHSTAGSDHTRAEGDHTTSASDHTTAAADHTAAAADHTQAGSDHTRAEGDHTTAASDHTLAAADHTQAASDHSAAASDHTRAGQDHTRSGSDHEIAVADHAQAEADHTRAESDHGTAAADHTQAGADHSTAAADHTLAASDHSTAAADHTQATADHAVMAGYDTRLTNVETDVTQLGQKLIKLVGWGQKGQGTSGVTAVGDVYYNTSGNLLQKCTEYRAANDFDQEQVPYRNGAIYSYNNVLYVYDGTELIPLEHLYSLTDAIEYEKKAIAKDTGELADASNAALVFEYNNIVAGKTYMVSGYFPSNTGYSLCAFYNKAGAFISSYHPDFTAGSTVQRIAVVAPNNCTVIRVFGQLTFKPQLETVSSMTEIIKEAADNQTRLEQKTVLSEQITNIDDYVTEPIERSSTIAAELTINGYTSSPLTAYDEVATYPIEEGVQYLVSGRVRNSSKYCLFCIYDGTGNLITYGGIGNTLGGQSIRLLITAPRTSASIKVHGNTSVASATVLKSLGLRFYKTVTLYPELIGGNPVRASATVGTVIGFGSTEANAKTTLHSRLYNVCPGTEIVFSCDINTVGLDVVFYDDNYIKVSRVTVHTSGQNWDNAKVPVPGNARKVIIQCTATDGTKSLSNINLQATLCLSKSNPFSFFPRSADEGYQVLAMKIGLIDMSSNSYTPSNTLQVETSYYVDYGMLCLPSTYTPDGEPTRLIAFCHGHAVHYTSSSTRFNTNDIKPEYWLSEGYAIFDMDGAVKGEYSGNHDYEPAMINAYDTAYEWIVRHFNVRVDGVFVTGRSMGGGTCLALAKRSKMPILAAAPMVCNTSPLGYSLLSISGSARKALLGAYGVPASELDAITWTAGPVTYTGLSAAEKQCILDNQWRIMQYTPGFMFNRPLTDAEITNWVTAYNSKDESALEAYYESVKGSINVSLFNNIPFRFYTCVGDPTAWYKLICLVHKAMANAAGWAQIHVFPATSDPGSLTDHRFEINPENLVTYTNSKGITLENVPKVYIETLAFWRLFENQDQQNS